MEHSELVSKLAKPGEDIIDDLTPDNAHRWHMASCICGEAGELFDAVKKGAIYGKEVDLDNVVEELGDLEFYMEGLRQSFGITREETLEQNKSKLMERYRKLSYSNEDAQARADKAGK